MTSHHSSQWCRVSGVDSLFPSCKRGCKKVRDVHGLRATGIALVRTTRVVAVVVMDLCLVSGHGIEEEGATLGVASCTKL
jgi:hypothetical protein